MSPRRARILGLGLAGLIFIVDQLLKWVIDGYLQMREGDSIPIVGIFALTRTHNDGVSLGLLSGMSPTMLVVTTAAIAITVFVWMLREKVLADIAGLALVLGGALGNICDRARFDYVLDYADLHFGNFRPFMIFNLADAAISIGVLIILARSFLSREKRADNLPAEPASES